MRSFPRRTRSNCLCTWRTSAYVAEWWSGHFTCGLPNSSSKEIGIQPNSVSCSTTACFGNDRRVRSLLPLGELGDPELGERGGIGASDQGLGGEHAIRTGELLRGFVLAPEDHGLR